MLEDRDIVCVAPSFWRADAPLNVHHVMGRLAPRNRVLLVESPGLRAPAAGRRDLAKVLRRLAAWLRGPRRAPEGLWLLAPLVVPLHGRAWARRLNARLLVAAVRRAMRRLGLERPILWIFPPTGAGLAGHLGERLVVYHCVDAYAENPGVDRAAILALEAELLGRCDLVLATSRALYEEKIPARGLSRYLPNVADAEHFAAAGPPPPVLARIARPRLGYVGNVAGYKVDLELLAAVALARPDWQLCLVGPRGAGEPRSDLVPLAGLPNVHLLGQRPYAELPAWVAGFDACLIPFRVSPSTRASFPLKFFEYMAAGKEIIATPLPALAAYADRPGLVRFAAGADAFVAAIEAALAAPQTETLRAARREEARRNAWPERMEDISRAVEEALAARAGEGGAP
ncbi:MAG: glycosyltransferase [Candidatus Krumholzibacteriota bacterium]|nr:glycosyltransferase [Candidatus Krumholzibacteriota bacterium]